MKFLGQQIANLKYPNLNEIETILTIKLPKNFVEGSILSWTLFDFVNPKKQMVFNSIHGRFDPYIDMSDREHLKFTQYSPWKLFFSPPTIGNPSNQFVIPAGMGIVSKGGEFYGTLVAGLNVEKLKEKISEFFATSNVSFLVVDDQNNLITQSPDLSLDRQNLHSFLKKPNIINGWLNKPILINQVSFSYIKQIKNSPYYIILGQRQSIETIELMQLTLTNILELLVLSIISIIIIYYLRYRICNPIEALAYATNKIANDKDIVIPNGRYSEINLLATQLEGIKYIKEQIKNLNTSLEQKIQERDKALTAKTEFLNNMSHEIRSPMTEFTSLLKD